MNDKSADFVHVLASMNPLSIVRIFGMSDGVNMESIRAQDPPDLSGKKLKL